MMRKLSLCCVLAALAATVSACDSEKERLTRDAQAVAEEIESAADRLPTIEGQEREKLQQWLHVACQFLDDRETRLRDIAVKADDAFELLPAVRHCHGEITPPKDVPQPQG